MEEATVVPVHYEYMTEGVELSEFIAPQVVPLPSERVELSQTLATVVAPLPAEGVEL